MSFRFTRTFHNVGQGAFYSERIVIDDNNSREFLAIYDCGSSSLDSKKGGALHERISSDLGSLNPKIDILFVSHFDKDHINGCKFLSPNIVVLPFLTENQVNLIKLLNNIGVINVEIAAIVNPSQFFPNSKIYQVTSEEGESERISVDAIETHDQSVQSINNGSTFTYPVEDGNLWEYLVYNPNWDNYFQVFKDKLNKCGLDFDKMLENPNGSMIYANFEKLKNIYKELKNKNQHSLQVYSGYQREDTELRAGFTFALNKQLGKLNLIKYKNEFNIVKTGCLYSGDIIVEDKWLIPYFNILRKENRLCNVGTVQIPHHGAHSAKGDKLLKELNNHTNGSKIVSVISVGENNLYGHPSAQVITNLWGYGSTVVLVTESLTTLYAEISKR